MWTASCETSQIEFSLHQKANERVQMGVMLTWPAVTGDASASTFALAAKYAPSQESSVKVRFVTTNHVSQEGNAFSSVPVSYTHLTLPTNREV